MGRLNLPKERTFTGPALLWKRIAAFFIDMALLSLFVFIPFRSIISSNLPQKSLMESFKVMASSEFTGYLLPFYIAMSLLMFLYFFMLENKMAQTIGKRIMKIYVVGDGKALKKWQVFVRTMLFIPVFAFDLLVIADPIFMLFTKSNQRLSEILSKTRVVENYRLE